MSVREIGSEFWNIPIAGSKNNIFKKDTTWFLSGRSALRAIIKDIKNNYDVKTVALPAWCCDSIVTPFIKENLKVKFYPVYFNDEFKQDICQDCDITFIMDYFGFQSEYECNSGIVIRDLTHNVFSNNHNDADYYFGSLRKWCGFPTGGFAYSKNSFSLNITNTNQSYIDLRRHAMKEKYDYICGNTDNKHFLSVFNEAEELLDTCETETADVQDIKSALYLDVDFIKSRRRDNAKFLLEAFSDIALFPKLNDNDCPLFVPIILENRDNLKSYLIDNNIFCPVHWPMQNNYCFDNRTKKLYQEELSLVCDQRYDINDMERMVYLIKKWFSK